MSDKPNSTIRVDVPGFDAAQVAREAVAARFAEAMVGQEEIVRKIVVAAMNERVDGRGVKSSYSSENQYSFVEWMAHDLMRKATIDVLRAKVDALRPAIEKEVEKQLRAQAKPIATLVANQFISQAGNNYGLTLNVSIQAKP